MEGGELEGEMGHGAISRRPKGRNSALLPISKGPEKSGEMGSYIQSSWGASPFLFQILESYSGRAHRKHTIIF